MSCTECPAFRVLGVCPTKPKREDYKDENKYLIDLESGVWDCKKTIGILCQKIQDLEWELAENLSDYEMCDFMDKKVNKEK